MAKTKSNKEPGVVQRLTQVVWAMEQRMNALEASMFDFAIRQRAMEELMTLRKLMTEADFNTTCERMIEEIKEMQEHARSTDGPPDRGTESDDSGSSGPGPSLVAPASGMASGEHADPISL